MRITRTSAAVAILLAGSCAGNGQQVPNPFAPGSGDVTPPGSMPPPYSNPSLARATASFPDAIDPRYASEPSGRARMLTCLDRYRANGPDGNGGLGWTQRGGGYYAICNRRLK